MWNPIDTAPKNTSVLVYAGYSMYVAWLVDDKAAPYYDPGQYRSDWDGLWVVTDNKHGPYPLRGDSPTYWMPLPEEPTKDN